VGTRDPRIGTDPALQHLLDQPRVARRGSQARPHRLRQRLEFALASCRASQALLLPYLAVQGAIWNLLRVISREPPFQSLDHGILIGRRLLSHEYPPGIGSVVDLTCEFSECLPRATSITYLNIPILDGGHLAPEALSSAIERIAALPRPLSGASYQGTCAAQSGPTCRRGALHYCGSPSTPSHVNTRIRHEHARCRYHRPSRP
jgi:hypothetical protein